jgi:hypothetical protein
MSEEVKLEPCPFCGGEAKFVDEWADWRVVCAASCSYAGTFVGTKEEVARIWNIRATTKANLLGAIDAGILEAAYERGRAAERERIVPLLNARKQTAAVSETRAQQNNKPHIALVYHNEVEVWDEAIAIVNQTE